ncbi:DUF998 domain-containing protein [Streptacidiphilus fuscans]|uniref:DUF998 domain-containing protein n=1 Tax=Streptacidiphilus fuscans TaxID=2789292 RepID=A0A931FF06_9ACTN|nr:DUF998 domain-containing protein [Streptacidiphilus fuscans]MBF9069785.1 DUF998 domain-containing protein [Streptacidiphilus fuscans]
MTTEGPVPADGTTEQDATTVKRLRVGVGVIGISLPIVLPLGNSLLSAHLGLLDSLSGSYYTHMRNVFVGGLWAIGVVLICYRHSPREDRWSSIAGFFAIVVSLCPTWPPSSLVPHPTTATDVVGTIHTVSAAIVFSALAFFCLRLFRDDGEPDGERRKRLYLVCGVVILACIVTILATALLHWGGVAGLTPVFAGESVSVFAFGLAWFVKSDAIADLAHLAGRPALAASWA